ncbi:MAG: acyl carrier protein [Gemmatimonadales bacterium]
MRFSLPYWLRTALGVKPDRSISTIEGVREEVLRSLSEVTDVPVGSIVRTALLVEDLRIDGDDYAMELIPALRWRFRINPPLQDWERVRTVGELEALVARHVGLADRGA